MPKEEKIFVRYKLHQPQLRRMAFIDERRGHFKASCSSTISMSAYIFPLKNTVIIIFFLF